MKNRTWFIVVSLIYVSCFFAHNALAQNRFNMLEEQLNLFRVDHPNLDDKINVSVTDLSIHDFLRGVAQSTGVNISVDNAIDFRVSNNFKDVVVSDLILFLCQQYDLALKIQGSILHIYPYVPDDNVGLARKKDSGVSFLAEGHLITIDVKDVPLYDVCRAITNETGVNIIPDQGIRNQEVSGYVYQMPFDNGIKDFLAANALIAVKDRDNVWKVSGSASESIDGVGIASKMMTSGLDLSSLNKQQEEVGGFVEIIGGDVPKISVSAIEIPVGGILKFVSDSLKVNYVFVEKLDEPVTIKMVSQDYNDFIAKLLRGTNYSFKKERDIYYFASRENKSFSIDKHVALQNRTIESIVKSIPESLSQGVSIVEYPELNSLFLSGEAASVLRLQEFILEIDQVIPVILIEVLIVDVTKNKSMSTGISAGMGKNPTPASQSFMPGIDYEFSTRQLDKLFQKFESFGWVNLGKVNPDFYLAIKAMEENGYLQVRSTPKLSTLNGFKATMSSGETKYYKEEQSNYFGSQNPALSSSYTWKPINADMSLSILPVVSGDDQVTLEIEVQQSEFTSREYEDSPPGSVSRNFKSLIRVKNQEMVLLGGLDRMSSQDTGKGVPFLARVPLLKWLFSSRTKAKNDSKLNVFIQPTIIY